LSLEKLLSLVRFKSWLQKFRRLEKDLSDYTAVIERPEAIADIKARALFNRGVTYGKKKQRKKAAADLKAVVKMPDAPEDTRDKAKRILDEIG